MKYGIPYKFDYYAWAVNVRESINSTGYLFAYICMYIFGMSLQIM